MTIKSKRTVVTNSPINFGSGMSSFAYLKNLPVDYLKIDEGFIKNIVTDSTALALTAVINQVGHAMGVQTIAEIVENRTVLEKITALGIDYAQGYGVAKPQLIQYGLKFSISVY